MLILGRNSDNVSVVLQPGQPAEELLGECPSACLQSPHLPTDGVSVISIGVHQHLLGRKQWVQHIRNGTELPPLVEQDFFNFNYQGGQPAAPNTTLMPGDRLITHCVWDTTSQTAPVYGGEGTQQEMCYSFALYYPANQNTLRRCIDLNGYYNASVCTSSLEMSNGKYKFNVTMFPYDTAPYVALPAETCNVDQAASSPSRLTKILIIALAVGIGLAAGLLLVIILAFPATNQRHSEYEQLNS